jgi:hypothetical protein
MPDGHVFNTRDAVARFEAAAARGLAAEATEQRSELAIHAGDLASILGWLGELGVNAAAIREAAGLLHDAIRDADWQRCRTIDAAGEWFDGADFSDLEALARGA